MADQSEVVRSLINVVAQNPELLKTFTAQPEETVQKTADEGGIDLSGVDMGDLVKAVTPLVSGDKLDVAAIANVAGELFGGGSATTKKAKKAAAKHAGTRTTAHGSKIVKASATDDDADEEGGVDVSEVIGALSNVFGEGTAHESKKNSKGGIDLATLGGIAGTLFGGK